jgi:hypothetical protein
VTSLPSLSVRQSVAAEMSIENRVREIIAVCDLKVSPPRQTGWKDFRGRRCTKVGVVVVVPFGFAATNCEIVERAETIDDRQIPSRNPSWQN